MGDRKILKLFNDLVLGEKGIILRRGRNRMLWNRRRRIGELDIGSEIYHVVLKIFKLVVNPSVAVLFGSIYVIQFIQYDVKSFIEGIEMNGFSAVTVTAAPYAKIGIYQQKGFCRQVIELKIPGGMISSYVTYGRHVKAVKAYIRIVVVKIRHALFFALPASVFTDIMACGGA